MHFVAMESASDVYCAEFNDYNGAIFNIRTRSINSMVYWMSQIVGSIAIALLLDSTKLTRRARAFAGWAVLFGMVFVVHIWAFLYQRYVFTHFLRHFVRRY